MLKVMDKQLRRDTGGAIKGHKIDVLMPDKASSSNWGRKNVKVTILN